MSREHYYYIITFGCQMNRNDSERMAAILQKMGLKLANKPEQADVIILNSCSVRESAESRIYGQVGNLAKLKQEKPNLIIGVTGCMPGRDKDGLIRKRLKGADLFFPTEEMIHLPKRLAELNADLRPVDLAEDYLQLRPNYNKKFQAFVTIQTGCNHFCTYCVVPYARGTEGNRPLKQVLAEVEELAQNGCLEVTLLGQIVNHYRAPDPEYFSNNNPYQRNDFAKLLWEINQFDGIERVHFTAPHPLYMDEEVIDALTLPKQVNYLHLPAQSGNTEILKKMNRCHGRDYYIKLIKRIREKRPDIAIGTDIIVGFCGETEEQFQDTVSLYKICDFDICYTAQYSARSGTVADKKFEDDLSANAQGREEKKRRWQILQDLMEEITSRKNKKYLGRTVSVLVDECKDGCCSGNSSEMKLVRFKGDESLIGKIVEVEVEKADTWMLEGKINRDKEIIF